MRLGSKCWNRCLVCESPMITVVVVVFGYLHTTFLDVVGAGAMASIHTVGEEKIAMVWKKYQKVESDARLKKKVY